MEINHSDLIELLRYQLNRSVTNLYKRYLSYAQEDLDFPTLRKKVLDDGNDVIRETEELLKKFEVLFDGIEEYHGQDPEHDPRGRVDFRFKQ
jgi:hypothetical protein